jgi:hypothetical protein
MSGSGVLPAAFAATCFQGFPGGGEVPIFHAPGQSTRYRDPLQEAHQVVGDVIHVGGIASFQFPALAKDFTGAFRHHQHSRHAERMGYFEITGEVLEHRRLAGVDSVPGEKPVVGLGKRFRFEFAGNDVEDVLEVMGDGEAADDGVGMGAGAVGENELAARQLFQGGA